MMKLRFGLMMGVLGCLALSCSLGVAAEETPPKLQISSLKAELYSELLFETDETPERGGARHVLKRDNLAFLAVAVQITATWGGNGGKRFSVRDEQITLRGEDGRKYPMVAEYERYGICEPDDDASFSFYNRGRPDVEAEGMIYAVPKTMRKFTFQAGDTSAKINMTTDPQPFPRPGDILEAQIIGSRLVKEVREEIDVGDKDVRTSVNNPHGKMLAVRAKFVFKRSNSIAPDSDHVFWHSRWISLRTEGGSVVSLVGEASEIGENVSRNWSHNSEAGREAERVFFFCVSEGMKNFELLFCNDPVAAGTVGEGDVPPPGGGGGLFD
jgi:hypothetical protein